MAEEDAALPSLLSRRRLEYDYFLEGYGSGADSNFLKFSCQSQVGKRNWNLPGLEGSNMFITSRVPVIIKPITLASSPIKHVFPVAHILKHHKGCKNSFGLEIDTLKIKRDTVLLQV